MPWMSSSLPGASPTNIRSARGFPTPNTTCVRPSACNLQRVQSPMSTTQIHQRRRGIDRVGRGERRRSGRQRRAGGHGDAHVTRPDHRDLGRRISLPPAPRGIPAEARDAEVGVEAEVFGDVAGGVWHEGVGSWCLLRGRATRRHECLDAVEQGGGERGLLLERHHLLVAARSRTSRRWYRHRNRHRSATRRWRR